MIEKETLENRFIAFVKNKDDAECIDDLHLTREQVKAKKGDFFFKDRSVICELKSLKKDTSSKVDDILSPHQNRPEWPIFYSGWKISTVLKYLPDGEKIGQRIIEAVSSAVSNGIRDANRQIRETKNSFHLPNAEGLLVLLNDAVEILSPHLIVSQIQAQLKKRSAHGEPRFPEIAVVWVIGETHSAPLSQNMCGQPLIMVINDYIKVTGLAEDLVNTFFHEWAIFEGLPLIDRQDVPMEKISFAPNSSVQPSSEPMKRYEIWQKEYKASPYLRNLGQEELLGYGEEILRDLNRTFVLDSPRKPTKSKEELAVLWTHLLEEINFRGLDMRKLRDRINFSEDSGPENIF